MKEELEERDYDVHLEVSPLTTEESKLWSLTKKKTEYMAAQIHGALVLGRLRKIAWKKIDRKRGSLSCLKL